MVESGPWTPGQVSFFFGFTLVFVSWVYAEILEYKKSSSPSKVHSDVNLAELGDETVKEDDRVVLLEGGLSKSASAKFQNSSVRANLIRFIRRDESFFLENRALLRAMSEFGATLVYFYFCDRTNLFSESKKKRHTDNGLYNVGLPSPNAPVNFTQPLGTTTKRLYQLGQLAPSHFGLS